MEVTPFKELLNLEGKAAVVTGGAKGIGAGIARRLAEAGAKVLIADTDEGVAAKTVQELESLNLAVESIKTDMASEDDIKAMIATCKDAFGSVDILVNNAGIYPQAPLADLSPELFDKVIRINLHGVFLATKYAAEIMKEQGSGKIIMITSIDAIHPSMVGLSHYDASKHGAWGFTKNVALELAKHNIQVNAIAPGGITTPGVEALQGNNPMSKEAIEKFTQQIPMGRFGMPDDIGTVALFLASPMANYMTGEQIVVDGGKLLS